MVPEINLTPQLFDHLQGRFPDYPVATLHSGMSEGERTLNWLAAHTGKARIILGTRLAVLASLPSLKLIIIDEEHDSSYKQEETVKRDQVLHGSLPAREAIRQLMDLTILEMIRDKQHKGCFLINSAVEVGSQDKDTNAIICQNERQLEADFYEVIKSGQSKGEISRKHDPRALSRFLLNTIVGLRVTGKSATDKAVFTDIIHLTMSILD